MKGRDRRDEDRHDRRGDDDHGRDANASKSQHVSPPRVQGSDTRRLADDIACGERPIQIGSVGCGIPEPRNRFGLRR
jgi:hypothetical protein